MATNNIVPRGASEGKLGTVEKPWGEINVDSLNTRRINSPLMPAILNAAARAWQPGQVVKKGDIRYPSTDKGESYMLLVCTAAGTTGAVEPTWPVVGEDAADGTVVWRVKDLAAEGDGVPVGTVIPYAAAVPPPGYLECNGSAVGRATYKELFAVVGTIYGAGDGTTTFNLPDYRGEFLRGWDHGRGVDAGRELGRGQEATRIPNLGFLKADSTSAILLGPSSAEMVNSAQLGVACSDGNINSSSMAGYFTTGLTITQYPNNGYSHKTFSTRPRNVAVMYCIKAFDKAVNQGMLDVAALANEVAMMTESKVDYGDFTQNFNVDTYNGYIILPNGAIFQWGSALNVPTTGKTYAFPIAFPNKCSGLQVSAIYYASLTSIVKVGSTNASSVLLYSTVANEHAHWFAYGH